MPDIDNISPGETGIRRVTPENFDTFVYLIEKLAEYENLSPPDGEAKSRLRADAFSDNPRYEAYLGSIDGKPAGYITFYFTYSTFMAKPTLYLEDIFVLEEYRKRGLGKALFEFCRDVARQRDCCRIDWAVLTWNEPSIQFYEQRGGKKQEWYLYRLEGEEI